MFSRTARKSALDIRIPSVVLLPSLLRPIRARYFFSTPQHIEPSTDGFNASQPPLKAAALPAEVPMKLQPTSISSQSSVPAPSPTPAVLDSSVKELLPLLAAQPSHFVSAHIHGRPYLVTAGDIVRLPFRMPGVLPGDVLRLNRASSLGSRDYTLKGAPYLDERIFECRARVMGVEAEPMRTKIKKKRRNRRTRIVHSKHKFTILRIADVKVNTLEDIEGL